MRIVFAAYFIIFCCATLNAQMDWKVDVSQSVELGKVFEIKFFLPHQKKDTVHLLFEKDSINQHIDSVDGRKLDLDILDLSNTVIPGQELDTSLILIKVMPWDTGYFNLEGLKYNLKNKINQLPKVNLEILIALMNNSNQIVDIREKFPEIPDDEQNTQMDESKTPWWIYMLSTFLGLGIFSSLIYWYWKNQRRKKYQVLTNFQRCMYKIEELDKNEIWKTDIKKFYTSLSLLLRTYLAEELKINLLEKTTTQCGYLLKKRINDNDLLKEILGNLNISDLVKFAGSKPDSTTIENSIKDIRLIVLKVDKLLHPNE